MTIRCPVCDGPLELREDGAECEVGHKSSHPELDRAMVQSIRKALWLAVRTVEDEMSRLKWIRQHRDSIATPGWKINETAGAADVLRRLAKQWDRADVPHSP